MTFCIKYIGKKEITIMDKGILRLTALSLLSALEIVSEIASMAGIFMVILTVAAMMYGSVMNDWKYLEYIAAPTIMLIVGGKVFYSAGMRLIELVCEILFEEEVEAQKFNQYYKKMCDFYNETKKTAQNNQNNQNKNQNQNSYSNARTNEYYNAKTYPRYDMDRISGIEKALSTLGIAKKEVLTESKIKTAFRKKAFQLHPDRNKGVDTTRQMQDLNNAHEKVLNDFEYYNRYVKGV